MNEIHYKNASKEKLDLLEIIMKEIRLKRAYFLLKILILRQNGQIFPQVETGLSISNLKMDIERSLHQKTNPIIAT